MEYQSQDLLNCSEQLTPLLLDTIVKKIVNLVNPHKIILFGSYGRGESTMESDLDLLIIMESELPRHQRSIPIYRALLGSTLPKDIIVYTPDEIAEWEQVPASFITTAVRSGKILYDKKSI